MTVDEDEIQSIDESLDRLGCTDEHPHNLELAKCGDDCLLWDA